MAASRKPSTLYTWLTFGVLCVACFAFFQLFYPYHLHHREQTMVYDGAFDLWHFGSVGDWLDSYLTQLFYYRIAGALIVTAVLALVWMGIWLLTLRITKIHWLAIVLATLAMVWQALCQTSNFSMLQAPLALGSVTLTIGLLWRKKGLAGLAGVLMLYFMGNPFAKPLWSTPDFAIEHRMAIDSEAYFGNWDKVLQLTTNTSHLSPLDVYYRNLAYAVQGHLADSLMHHQQIGTQGLMPTLGAESNYMTMNALGEAWYRIGALTDAEHCAMLGLVFSPHSTGSRYLKRLAEVNLANGDTAAAMKYLRILLPTPVHGKWARQRLPGQQTQQVADEIAQLRKKLPQTDSLHLANDIVLTLRHMVDASPNQMAYDYLLCLHLINKNLDGFMEDFNPEMRRSHLYDEALIYALLQRGADAETAMAYNIRPEVLRRYKEYSQKSLLGPQALKDFDTTYWYYYSYL